MKPEKTKQETITEAIKELETALLEDLKNKEDMIKLSQKTTKTHYNLLKAKERVATLST